MFMDDRVVLTPSQLNAIHDLNALQETLHANLSEKHEGKCNANGHVRPGSLELLKRSAGVAENGRFTGNFVYDCKFKCDVLYPLAESDLTAYVIKVTKMGAYAHYDHAIRILLPRESHVGNEEYNAIQEGSTVRVRIDMSRFQTNDPYIMSVGTLLSLVPEPGSSSPLPGARTPASPNSNTGFSGTSPSSNNGNNGNKSAQVTFPADELNAAGSVVEEDLAEVGLATGAATEEEAVTEGPLPATTTAAATATATATATANASTGRRMVTIGKRRKLTAAEEANLLAPVD